MGALNTLESELEARLCELGLKTSHSRGHDLVVELPTADGPKSVAVEVKTSDSPVSTSRLAAHGSNVAPVILGQRHVPSGLGKKYRAAGLNYIDSGGNAWLNAPGYFVHIEGRKPTLASTPGSARPSRAHRPAGLHVVFTLLVSPELVASPLRVIAEAARVSLGAAQGAIADLHSQGFLFTSGGKRILTDTGKLSDIWVSRYATDLLPKLQQVHLHGPEPTWWRAHRNDGAWDATLSGEAAMAALGYPIRPVTSTIYGEHPWHNVRRQARLTSGEPANVILRQRFWDPAILATGALAPSLLVYADALASDESRQIESARGMREADAELLRLYAGS